ncbi:MAG: hypothetical protein IPI67_39750 [Myxococcales bacterium]|nr:hypothetical protein [Myxococcales bacterium]
MVGAPDGRVVFFGDEVTALGFGLAGIETLGSDAADARAVVQAARDAAVVIVTAELAHRLVATPGAARVVGVGSARSELAPPDFANHVRRTLGIAP